MHSYAPHWIEVSDQLYAAGSFIPGEISAVTIEYKAVWVPETDWTLEERKTSCPRWPSGRYCNST